MSQVFKMWLYDFHLPIFLHSSGILLALGTNQNENIEFAVCGTMLNSRSQVELDEKNYSSH